MKTIIILCLVIAGSSIIYSLETDTLFETDQVSGEFAWNEVKASGKGSHQQDWKPGDWPKGITPIVAFNQELWVTGQKKSWSSADGVHWKDFGKKDWIERIGIAQVYFNNKLWMFGGLEYANHKFLNDVWSSADGQRWARSTEHAAWPARKGHTVVAFDKKLWLFGGANGVTKDRTSDQFLNDVWTSTDGVQWTRVTAAAPWSPRESPNVVVFKNQLWMLGGQGHSDIWRSTDGKQWIEVRKESPWTDRYDQGVMVYSDLLWVYGGREANPRNAYNDVWYSADGTNWQQQADHAPWAKRSGVNSVVFKNKLWIFSGKHTGRTSNWKDDIWTMEEVRSKK